MEVFLLEELKCYYGDHFGKYTVDKDVEQVETSKSLYHQGTPIVMLRFFNTHTYTHTHTHTHTYTHTHTHTHTHIYIYIYCF